MGANGQLQLLLENSKSIRRHNQVQKNLRITSPTGKVTPFEFQVNISCQDRDIRKCQIFCMMHQTKTPPLPAMAGL